MEKSGKYCYRVTLTGMRRQTVAAPIERGLARASRCRPGRDKRQWNRLPGGNFPVGRYDFWTIDWRAYAHLSLEYSLNRRDIWREAENEESQS